jgi:hypothetical protein
MFHEKGSAEMLISEQKDTIKMHLKKVEPRARDSIKLVQNVVMLLV